MEFLFLTSFLFTAAFFVVTIIWHGLNSTQAWYSNTPALGWPQEPYGEVGSLSKQALDSMASSEKIQMSVPLSETI